jgi:hypothetical protein
MPRNASTDHTDSTDEYLLPRNAATDRTDLTDEYRLPRILPPITQISPMNTAAENASTDSTHFTDEYPCC